LMFWNFSPEPVSMKLDLVGLPETLTAHRRTLDAATPFEDENARLRHLDDIEIKSDAAPPEVNIEPYGIQFWSLEPLHWPAQILGRDPRHPDSK